MKYDKIETIDDLTRKERDSVYEPEVMDTPDYSYGASQEPLNAQFQVRNIPSSKVVTGFVDVSDVSTYTVGGLGFQPSKVEIKAMPELASGTWAYSHGYKDKNGKGCSYMFDDGSIGNGANNNVFDLYWSETARCTDITFNSDGFIMDLGGTWTGLVRVFYTAYQ